MSLEDTAKKAMQSIDDALAQYDLNDQEKSEVLKIIGKTLIQTVEQACASHHEVTAICCGPEADLAHKIAEGVELKKKALIANLMALR